MDGGAATKVIFRGGCLDSGYDFHMLSQAERKFYSGFSPNHREMRSADLSAWVGHQANQPNLQWRKPCGIKE